MDSGFGSKTSEGICMTKDGYNNNGVKAFSNVHATPMQHLDADFLHKFLAHLLRPFTGCIQSAVGVLKWRTSNPSP